MYSAQLYYKLLTTYKKILDNLNPDNYSTYSTETFNFNWTGTSENLTTLLSTLDTYLQRTYIGYTFTTQYNSSANPSHFSLNVVDGTQDCGTA